MTPKLTHFGVTNVSNVFRKYKIQRGPQNWYCAPEQLDPPKKNPPPMSKIYDYGSPKQDVYSMGMVLVALCTMKEEHGKPAELAKGIPWQGLRDLVYLMTKPRADDRPTAEAVVHQLAALRGAEGYTEGL
jgi:serine/threonine protein kinase